MAAERDEEVLLAPSQHRAFLFPIVYHNLWEQYTQHKENFWTAQELDSLRVTRGWNLITADEQDFIVAALGVLAANAIDNITERFSNDVYIPEARCFFGLQSAMQHTHAETLSILIDTYIKSADEKQALFRDTLPVVEMKVAWLERWIKTNPLFGERLVALAVVEGIFLRGAHCAFSWLNEQGKMPGLSACNYLISRGKSAHRDFACLLFNMLSKKPSEQTVSEIVCSAVTIEKILVCEAVRGIGIDPLLMSAYIEFVADKLLVALGFPKLWKVANPFPWTDTKVTFMTKPLAANPKPQACEEAFAMDADF